MTGIIDCAHKRIPLQIALSGILAVSLAVRAIASPLEAPTTATVTEAKAIVERMINNPRGPYTRIRWYCNDGTIQPPVAFACQNRGGGRQHAEYSAERARLAALGWHVGTIFAPLDFTTLRTELPREQRLRELPLERYMLDIDDGWILRRAKGYRGRVQLEDEVAAGRRILLDALANPEWVETNFLLVRELVRAVPHAADTDLARQVRRGATELAELYPPSEPWRAEIHSAPSRSTAKRLRAWSAGVPDADIRQRAQILADDLDQLYGESGRQERLAREIARLQSPAASRWREELDKAMQQRGKERVDALCLAIADARQRLLQQIKADERLAVFDLLTNLEIEVSLAFSAERWQTLTRAMVIESTQSLARCAYGTGLLSAGELATLVRQNSTSQKTLTPSQYSKLVSEFRRAPGWVVGTVRHSFAEPLTRYIALDPRAARYSDDLIRSSALLAFGDLLRLLSQDVNRLNKQTAEIAGLPVGGAIALNAGLARGVLRVYETLAAVDENPPGPTDIVALPEAIAELSRVAGILTLGEGNPLSHVQLLARNFGIPNVAIDFATVEMLKPLQNSEVLLAVGRNGDFILREASSLADNTPTNGQLITGDNNNVEQLTVPLPDLDLTKILALDEIDRSLSGKVIGPKAANLGELNRLFPNRVAPAMAIPFGIYARHLDSSGIRAALRKTYADYRTGAIDKAGLDAELEAIRQRIAGLTLDDTLQAQIARMAKQEFGPPEGYGVFVRSDTNVEDLPQFTGAGLSETVPHIVDQAKLMAAIPRVWASVLSPRALAWRSSLLTNPEEVYASVLIMRSVSSDKSGVLVTRNIVSTGAAGLTVSTGWGVGGAVAGEAVETLLLLDSGQTELVSENKSPYRRGLSIGGGVEWLPAAAGPVLTAADIRQLRELAQRVAQIYSPVYDESGRQRPWDIEFGFVAGDLTLFQIRPLVEKQTDGVDQLIIQLTNKKPEQAVAKVELDTPLFGVSL